MKTENLYADFGEHYALTLNRAESGDRFTLPADGWFQIAQVGSMQKEMELPGSKTPIMVQQVVNVDDLSAIANRFNAWAKDPAFDGLLVDFDHFSDDQDKSTRAAAWIMNVEQRGGGLWAKLRLTSSGRLALEGGDFRHFSPVLGFQRANYRAGDVVHPAALLGGAFTNKPTFRGMVPLSNRQGEPLATNKEGVSNMDYKAKLLALLGLAASATDAEIETALAPATENMQNGKKFPETKCRLDKLEAAQIERDLDDHGIKGEAREKWKSALTKNRDEALPLLASLGSDGSGYARTHNRDAAKAPADAAKKEKSLDERRDEAVREYRTKNRCDFDTAWKATRADHPELFVEAKTAE